MGINASACQFRQPGEDATVRRVVLHSNGRDVEAEDVPPDDALRTVILQLAAAKESAPLASGQSVSEGWTLLGSG